MGWDHDDDDDDGVPPKAAVRPALDEFTVEMMKATEEPPTGDAERAAFASEAAAARAATLATLGAPPSLLRDVAAQRYTKALTSFCKKGTMTQPRETAALAALRIALGLTDDAAGQARVAMAHREACMPVFRKAAMGALGANGIISPRERAGLEQIRAALLLDTADTEREIEAAVASRVAPLSKALLSALKRDKGEEPEEPEEEERREPAAPAINRLGIQADEDAAPTTEAAAERVHASKAKVGTSLQSAVLKLVDYYAHNELLPEAAGDDAAYHATPLAVTLKSSLSDEERTDVYREFVAKMLEVQVNPQTRETEAPRLTAALVPLTHILALDEKTAKDVRASIGGGLAERYLSAKLRMGHVALNERDRAFLQQLANSLQLSDQTDDLFWRAKKAHVQQVVGKVFFSNAVDETAVVRRLRDTAVSLGVDLFEDVEMGKRQRQKMFRTELKEAIRSAQATEAGELFDGDAVADAVGDLTDEFRLDEKTVEEELTDAFLERALEAARCANGLCLTGDTAAAMIEISNLVAYCKLSTIELGGKDGKGLGGNHTKTRLVDTYVKHAEGARDDIFADGEILRTALSSVPAKDLPEVIKQTQYQKKVAREAREKEAAWQHKRDEFTKENLAEGDRMYDKLDEIDQRFLRDGIIDGPGPAKYVPEAISEKTLDGVEDYFVMGTEDFKNMRKSYEKRIPE